MAEALPEPEEPAVRVWTWIGSSHRSPFSVTPISAVVMFEARFGEGNLASMIGASGSANRNRRVQPVWVSFGITRTCRDPTEVRSRSATLTMSSTVCPIISRGTTTRTSGSSQPIRCSCGTRISGPSRPITRRDRPEASINAPHDRRTDRRISAAPGRVGDVSEVGVGPAACPQRRDHHQGQEPGQHQPGLRQGRPDRAGGPGDGFDGCPDQEPGRTGDPPPHLGQPEPDARARSRERRCRGHGPRVRWWSCRATPVAEGDQIDPPEVETAVDRVTGRAVVSLAPSQVAERVDRQPDTDGRLLHRQPLTVSNRAAGQLRTPAPRRGPVR